MTLHLPSHCPTSVSDSKLTSSANLFFWPFRGLDFFLYLSLVDLAVGLVYIAYATIKILDWLSDWLNIQQFVRSWFNASSDQAAASAGKVGFNIVRSGVVGDVTVYWRLGPEASSDFYLPLNGSVFFRDVSSTLFIRWSWLKKHSFSIHQALIELDW